MTLEEENDFDFDEILKEFGSGSLMVLKLMTPSRPNIFRTYTVRFVLSLNRFFILLYVSSKIIS